MNKGLFINGEKFISAKRAEQDLGYSADYIGQLARSGSVVGKMIGRTWYVSRKSLLQHKRRGSVDKSAKVGRPIEGGKKDLYIGGDRFISSQKAASETGYTTDYIGQLARSGSVVGKMIGRTWYVSRKSILGQKKTISPVQRTEISKPKAPTPRAYVIKKPAPARAATKSISYTTESLLSLPKLSKEKIRPTNPNFLRNLVAISLSVMIIATTAYSWINFLAPNMGDRVNITIAQVMDKVDTVAVPIEAGSSHLALAIGSSIKGFFTGILSAVIPPTTVVAPLASQTTKTAGEGVVVTQDSGSHSDTVTKIKNIFSDEVNVLKDSDGTAGVITPVFTSSTSSDKYTFVLVPIKESQK